MLFTSICSNVMNIIKWTQLLLMSIDPSSDLSPDNYADMCWLLTVADLWLTADLLLTLACYHGCALVWLPVPHPLPSKCAYCDIPWYIWEVQCCCRTDCIWVEYGIWMAHIHTNVRHRITYFVLQRRQSILEDIVYTVWFRKIIYPQLAVACRPSSTQLSPCTHALHTHTPILLHTHIHLSPHALHSSCTMYTTHTTTAMHSTHIYIYYSIYTLLTSLHSYTCNTTWLGHSHAPILTVMTNHTHTHTHTNTHTFRMPFHPHQSQPDAYTVTLLSNSVALSVHLYGLHTGHLRLYGVSYVLAKCRRLGVWWWHVIIGAQNILQTPCTRHTPQLTHIQSCTHKGSLFVTIWNRWGYHFVGLLIAMKRFTDFMLQRRADYIGGWSLLMKINGPQLC